MVLGRTMLAAGWLLAGSAPPQAPPRSQPQPPDIEPEARAIDAGQPDPAIDHDAMAPRDAPPLSAAPDASGRADALAAPQPVACADKAKPGKRRRNHELVGKSVAEVDAHGGTLICVEGRRYRFRFGTLCGDYASFHEVVTVEVRAGKVNKVWLRSAYNDAFCGEPDF